MSQTIMTFVTNKEISKGRSSYGRCSIKKAFLKIFAKFTGKHLCRSLRPATLLKKRLRNRCFPVNFAKFLIRNFEEQIPANASDFCNTDLISLMPKAQSELPKASKMESF